MSLNVSKKNKNMKINYLQIIFFVLIIPFSLFGQSPKVKKGTPQYKDPIDRKTDSVLNKMTLEEKIGQLTLFTSDWDVTGPTIRKGYADDIRSGKCGNIFNAHTAAYNRKLQEIAMTETRMKIPLLFGYDVIHGYKTIFPIPLGEAASWDLVAIEKSAKIAAEESAAAGLHWTFAKDQSHGGDGCA